MSRVVTGDVPRREVGCHDNPGAEAAAAVRPRLSW